MLSEFSVLIGVAAFLLGVFGGLAVWHRAKSRADAQMADLKVQLARVEEDAHRAASEHLQWVETTEQRMRDEFHALASDALKSNAEVFSLMVKRDMQTVVGPLCDQVRSMEQAARALEATGTQT